MSRSVPYSHSDSAPFTRELYVAYRAALGDLLNTLYGNMLLSPYFAPAAETFARAAEVQTLHLRCLGEWLTRLGVDPAVHARVQTERYRLHADADAHAPVLARRMLGDAAKREAELARRCRRLAEQTQDTPQGAALARIGEEKQTLADTIQAAAERLSAS